MFNFGNIFNGVIQQATDQIAGMAGGLVNSGSGSAPRIDFSSVGPITDPATLAQIAQMQDRMNAFFR